MSLRLGSAPKSKSLEVICASPGDGEKNGAETLLLSHQVISKLNS